VIRRTRAGMNLLFRPANATLKHRSYSRVIFLDALRLKRFSDKLESRPFGIEEVALNEIFEYPRSGPFRNQRKVRS